MTCSKHYPFLYTFLLLEASKSGSLIFEVNVFLIEVLFYFFGKLDFSEESVIILYKIWGLLRLPGHSFVDIIVLLIIPSLLLAFGMSLLFQPLSEHVIVHFIQLLLKKILALLQVSAQTDLH